MAKPVPVDEVTLTIDWTAPEVPSALPARVVLPEPMLRFACNQQGCCCGGWRIGFQAHDLVRLRRRLDDGDRVELTRDLEFRVVEDHEGDRVVNEFFIVDEAGSCRFLKPDHRQCGLHAKYGVDALPDLCVDFPVATFTESPDAAAFYFDPVCPSVLDQLAESDAPMTIAEVPTDTADPAFQLRARHTKGIPIVRLRGEELGPGDVELVRRRLLDGLADVTRPPWQHLQAMELAAVRLAAGDVTPDTMRLDYAGEPGPFLRHLGLCLGAHGHVALTQNLFEYRRFVFDLPMDAAAAAWDALPDHLVDWGPAYDRWLAPSEDALRPLLLRWLALRAFTPYAAPKGDLRSAIGRTTHVFCTALRYAAALGAVFGREVDRPMMKVAIGAAEYFYRSRQIAPENMPWFEPEAGRDG